MSLRNVEVFVVGKAGNLRNPSLIDDLHALGVERCEIASRDLRAAGSEVVSGLADQAAARAVLGRNLTGGEIGCAVSHRDHWTTALNRGCDWALVLEDDAFLEPPFSEALRMALTLPTDVPAIVALYDWPQAGITTPVAGEPIRRGSHVDLYLCVHNTNCSLGYLVNRPALGILMDDRDPLICPADWPPAAGRIPFLVAWPYPLFTILDQSHSAIGPRRPPDPPPSGAVRRSWDGYVKRYRRLRGRFPGYSAYVRWSYGSGRGFMKHARTFGLIHQREAPADSRASRQAVLSPPLASMLGLRRRTNLLSIRSDP